VGKKNKVQNQETRKPKYPVAVPEVVSYDDIGYLSDETIFDRLSRLENDRIQVLNAGLDTYAWEVEIAYLRREQQIRNVRLERHSQYMKSLPREEEHYYAGYAGFDHGEEEFFDQKTLN
jgi:hypothetical protein